MRDPTWPEYTLSGAAVWVGVRLTGWELGRFSTEVFMREGYAYMAKLPGRLRSSTRAEAVGGC